MPDKKTGPSNKKHDKKKDACVPDSSIEIFVFGECFSISLPFYFLCYFLCCFLFDFLLGGATFLFRFLFNFLSGDACFLFSFLFRGLSSGSDLFVSLCACAFCFALRGFLGVDVASSQEGSPSSV